MQQIWIQSLDLEKTRSLQIDATVNYEGLHWMPYSSHLGVLSILFVILGVVQSFYFSNSPTRSPFLASCEMTNRSLLVLYPLVHSPVQQQ